MSDQIRGSPTQASPWTWAEKAALRLARETLDGDSMTTCVIAAYHALCENSSDKQGQNPFKTSQPYLAKLTGCSVRQFQKALKILRLIGLVEVQTPALRGPCTYTLRIIDGTIGTMDVTLRTVLNRAPEPTIEEQEKKLFEGQKEESPSADAEDAVEIYELYPRKVAKQAALRAIRKALKRLTKGELLEKTDQFAKATDGADMQYIPHPATWYQGERFNDPPEEWSKIGRSRSGTSLTPGLSIKQRRPAPDYAKARAEYEQGRIEP